MDKILKALTAFIAISISITTSLPKNGVVEVVENNPSVYFRETSNFFQTNRAIQELVRPVVKIDVVIEAGESRVLLATGTGFGIYHNKKDNISYLLTNAHICNIRNEVPFPIRFHFENSEKMLESDSPNFSGELFPISMDISKDLCLMISAEHITPAKLAPENYNIVQMEKIKIVGGPNGIFPIVLDSYISNLLSRKVLGQQEGRPLLLISEIIFGGQSGSPVFNKRNEVIGVIFMNLSDQSGPIYGAAAIPLQDIREFLQNNHLDI